MGTMSWHRRTVRTRHHPLWGRCSSHFHLFAFTIFPTQVSRVTIGTRSGRSTVLGLHVAALLSLGFAPSRVPLVNARQLDLTPLFMCSSLCEQSIRHVKWRGRLKAGARDERTLEAVACSRLFGPVITGKAWKVDACASCPASCASSLQCLAVLSHD